MSQPVARPLFWLSLAFVAGIGLGLGEPNLPSLLPLLLLGALICGVRGGHGRLAFAAALAISLLLGLGRGAGAAADWSRQPLRRWLGQVVELEGTIVATKPQRAGQRVDLAVTRLRREGQPWRPLAGRVRLPRVTAPVAEGARVRGVVRLVEPRTAGNPGGFSERRLFRRQDLAATALAVGSLQVIGAASPGTLAARSRRLREALRENLRARMPGGGEDGYGDLLAAMVFGISAAPVSPELEEACRRAGVVHVLVASGTQVSLLLALVFLLTRTLPVPGCATFAAATALVGGYLLVTGLEPSILRAAVMGLLIFYGLAAGHDHDLPTALAFSAGFLTLLDPFELQDIGFQLSFAATAGIVALGIPLAARRQGRGSGLIALVVMTCAAQLAVAPVLVYHFRELSVIGFVANLPIIPLSGVLVVLGLAASALGPVAPLVAGWLCAVAHLLLGWFVTATERFAALPGGWWSPLAVPPAALAGYLLLLGVLAMTLSPRRARRWSAPPMMLVALGLLAAVTGVSTWRLLHGELSLTVLDVGHGDSLLLRGPTGRTMLIDGGPRLAYNEVERDAGRDAVVPALMLTGVRRLDEVVATHQHADHVGGLTTVVGAWPVGRLWLPSVGWDSPAVEALVAAAERRGVRPETLQRGQRLELGGGARVYVLWPPAAPVTGTDSDINNNAVVLKLVYGEVAMLLTSDLEAAGERYLLRHAGDLSADVLKVPHQGSDDSCSDEFLDQVQPRWAAISCGPNRHGHPGDATLARLAARGVTVNRTDRDGMTTYRTNGRTISVETYGRR